MTAALSKISQSQDIKSSHNKQVHFNPTVLVISCVQTKLSATIKLQSWWKRYLTKNNAFNYKSIDTSISSYDFQLSSKSIDRYTVLPELTQSTTTIDHEINNNCTPLLVDGRVLYCL
jgi:hypothetical protein